MFFLNLSSKCLFVYLLTTALGFADSSHIVEHHDPIESDATLSLSKVVDLTLEKYPDETWLKSLEEEAAALAQRGNSWTAGASQAGLRFQEATGGTLHYIDAQVQVPLWNLGQRDAEQTTAKLAENSAMSQTVAVKLRVSGLVRGAIWNIALANISYEQAKIELDVTDQLLAKVQTACRIGRFAQSRFFAGANRVSTKTFRGNSSGSGINACP